MKKKLHMKKSATGRNLTLKVTKMDDLKMNIFFLHDVTTSRHTI